MLRKVLRVIIQIIFHLLARIEATGMENIPTQGAAILATNHLGRLDAALVFIQLDRQDVTGLVAEKYEKRIFFRWLISIVGGIWIDRQAADLGALRKALAHLRQGGMLGIAPEGTRSTTGAMMLAKPGIAYLVDKAKAPVIPIAITGTEKIWRELARLRRPRITIHFGEPLILPPIDHHNRNESMQRNTDEIVCQIAAMLPPAYRGVYADHPRLKELLAFGSSR